MNKSYILEGLQYLSCGVMGSRARGWGIETYLHHVVSLRKTLYSPKVLVISRKQWFYMTEKLLTGTLSLDINKKHNLDLLIY